MIAALLAAAQVAATPTCWRVTDTASPAGVVVDNRLYRRGDTMCLRDGSHGGGPFTFRILQGRHSDTGKPVNDAQQLKQRAPTVWILRFTGPGGYDDGVYTSEDRCRAFVAEINALEVARCVPTALWDGDRP